MTTSTTPDDSPPQDGSTSNLSNWIGWGIFLLLAGALILSRMFGVSC